MWKSGTISANTSWSGVVFVRGDVIVESGATLTIAAGTDVWMWPTQVGTNLGADATLCELLVENGGLVVNGTSDAPVRFLAWETNGPESSANDKWFGIWVDDGCSATINYATIRNALRGIQARSPITVKNSTIEDCKIVGMTVAGDSTNADSVYVENTTIRRIGRTSGGIGVNVLGKKAVVKLKSCDVDSCEIGIACYTKGKLYTDDTDVRNATTHGLRVNNRAAATLYNSRFESHAMSAVRVYNASEVSATACTFGTSDYGAEITSEGGSPSFGTFTSCTFTENDVGLRVVSGSEAIVSASTFSNDDDGIYDIGATVQVAGTTLDSDFNAAVLDGEATADFTSSTVGTNDGGTGIRVTDASYVGLVNSRIWHNLLGVWVDEASATSLDNCSSTCPSTCANGNSFMYNGTRHIKNQNSSGTIDAECNYWGAAPPDASKFYGSVDYTPYLSADPTDELMVFALPSKLPKEYRLAQNYPNPFNPVTTIAYDVPSPGGKVEIRVYSVNGQLVRSVVSGFRPPGEHRATWPGVSNANVPVASGVYFLRMDAPNFRATRKLILLK